MQGLISTLAAALGELHPSPGKGIGWVDRALRRFERQRPNDYGRMRRVHGLARKLAALGHLGDEESATLTIGLFFSGLLSDFPDNQRSKAPRSWAQYLRHETWVAQCLHVAHFVRLPSWEYSGDSMAAVLAKAAWSFDTETVIRGSRALTVLKSLRAQAGAPGTARVVQLFWSEEGQELCHRHVRHHGQPYTLKPSDIKNSIQLLTTASRSSASAIGAAAPPGRTAQEARRARGPQSPVSPVTSKNFELRKRALSAAPGSRSIFGVSTAQAGGPKTGHPLERREAEEGVTPASQAGRSLTELQLRPAAEPEPTREESRMDTRSKFPTRPHARDDVDVVEKLEELKTRLVQIEQLAAEGRELLAALGPSLQEFSSMVAEFESMMTRWKGLKEAGAQEAA